MYILVIDNDHFANALIQFVLSKEGYDVETVDNSYGALQMVQKREPDLLLLNTIMPQINGFDLLVTLRSKGFETPVIFITEQDTMEAKLKGLGSGADDYICKPYNHQELLVRIKTVMRRIKKYAVMGAKSIRGGQIELFPAELKAVLNGGVSVQLTPTEVQVLRVLIACSGQVVHREQILAEVWNYEDSSSNIVDVYIRRLRSKLNVSSNQAPFILSVRGLGYKFVAS